MIKPGEGITLDGTEYLCIDTIRLNDRDYVYLTTIEEPLVICFAEQKMQENELQIREISTKAEKIKLFEAFQQQIKQKLSDS